MFHYRLLQAHVSDAMWSIMPDWERWLRVERLATNPEQLARMEGYPEPLNSLNGVAHELPAAFLSKRLLPESLKKD